MSFVIFDGCPPNCKGFDIGEGKHSGCRCKGSPEENGYICDCPRHIVKTVEKLGCNELYFGPSYPQFHGTRCTAQYHESDDERHSATVENNGQREPIYWYSAAQKEKLRAERGPGNGRRRVD